MVTRGLWTYAYKCSVLFITLFYYQHALFYLKKIVALIKMIYFINLKILFVCRF